MARRVLAVRWALKNRGTPEVKALIVRTIIQPWSELRLWKSEGPESWWSERPWLSGGSWQPEAIIIKKRRKKTTRKNKRTEMTQRRYSVFIKVKPCIFFAAFYCRFALFICVFLVWRHIPRPLFYSFPSRFQHLRYCFIIRVDKKHFIKLIKKY